ncbi:CAP domain-containing protein [Pseudalkalibacillus hwajinpoensis]|uniref:Sporulation protein n=1 Tax=Guptibacillus hwajinpoensis TaxID=208199 RepID=A0A4U1MLF4_9BACL|nr:CAP domain-containing protein [Pseudalkalibacillus hwajinpoensis]TKD72033.1 sporulation protein [Pseudalkalibacillus hwajinpoensis]
MKKSIILGVTAATALLAANPTTSSASTGDNQFHAEVKAHTFEVKNISEFQSIIERFEKQYNISIQGLDQLQQQQLQAEQPQQKQAPAKEQAQPEQKEQATPSKQAQPEQKEQAAPSKQAQPEVQEPNKEQSKQESSLSEFEQQVVNLTNQEREKAGLPALEVDSELSKVAQAKSEDMRDNNYFAHNSPTYGSPFDMMNQFGVEYQTAGENIAKGQQTPEEVVNAWMNSEGHRKNIMNGSFTHIGVGYVEEGNIWTQQFIGK